MAFNNLTSRTDAQALIPEQVVTDMLGFATKESAALTMFRKIPIAGQQARFPVLSALPVAYWVNGDTGLKQTTEMAWTNKYLNVEELAVIMPVPENVADDVTVNVWDTAMPYMSEAIGRALDSAIFFGYNAPQSFPQNITASALAAGNAITSIPNAAGGGYMGAIDALYGAVESDGFGINGFVGNLTARGKLRTARNTQGDKTDPGRIAGNLADIDGVRFNTDAMQGLWPSGTGTPELFGADWNQFVLGVRKDVTFKLLDQAALFDGSGNLMINLPQQDSIALRVTFRAGWQVANTINYQSSSEASRYPAGYIAN